MKNSKKVLIGALLAASTLVGATVATYVVTDNAAPVGIQVTPGTLSTDGKVTLSWGENTIANVSQLALGSAHRAGNLILKAENSKPEGFNAYVGNLNISLEDLTIRPSQYSGAKFIDYLNVHLFEKKAIVSYEDEVMPEAVAANGYIGKIPTENSFSKDFQVDGTPSGKEYVIYVDLDQNASPVYETIKNDIVYVTFNWNKATADTDASDAANMIYLYDENDLFADHYVYAYEGGKNNGEWPGKQMSLVSGKLYSYALESDLTTIIFNNGNDGLQTGNIQITLNGLGGIDQPYFTLLHGDDYYVTTSATNPLTLADYYVTGSFAETSDFENGWYNEVGFKANNAMDEGNEDNHAIKLGVHLTEGDKLKIVGKDGTWYSASPYAQEGDKDADANWVISETATYDIYLNNDNFIWVSKVVVNG